MARQKIELPIGGFERNRPINSGMIGLHKGDASHFPRRSDESNRHFIGSVECFDQDIFVSFEPNRIFHKEFRQIVEPNIVHMRLMIPLGKRDATELFSDARLTRIDETRGKGAVEMVSKRQAKFLVRESHLWKLGQHARNQLFIFFHLETARAVNKNATRF